MYEFVSIFCTFYFKFLYPVTRVHRLHPWNIKQIEQYMKVTVLWWSKQEQSELPEIQFLRYHQENLDYHVDLFDPADLVGLPDLSIEI